MNQVLPVHEMHNKALDIALAAAEQDVQRMTREKVRRTVAGRLRDASVFLSEMCELMAVQVDHPPDVGPQLPEDLVYRFSVKGGMVDHIEAEAFKLAMCAIDTRHNLYEYRGVLKRTIAWRDAMRARQAATDGHGIEVGMCVTAAFLEDEGVPQSLGIIPHEPLDNDARQKLEAFFQLKVDKAEGVAGVKDRKFYPSST